MEEKMNLLSLKDLANGALQEKVDAAMQKVLENMQDPNTPGRTKGRSISGSPLSRMRAGTTQQWRFLSVQIQPRYLP